MVVSLRLSPVLVADLLVWDQWWSLGHLPPGLSWNVLVHGVESRPMLMVKRDFEDAVNYFG
ncbi:hypothetical protein PVK06_019067 [Gossypium arboreum]|uniref:Uncharacterized protein n=1 Tax=Gossypium arboreum TaxID=29729 RepID=A0ABR0PIN7_GOSAR|nr:hypothetical protein PVK06_019067 [Gossypium arboreum]